jgi:hypothetical protein
MIKDNDYYDSLKGVNQWAMSVRVNEMKKELPQSLINQYEGKCGIYGMWINEKLVYIGKSKNVLTRWTYHKLHTLYDYGQHDYKEDKYRIMREAKEKGYKISFDILEECKPGCLDLLEHRWIEACKPALNMEFTNQSLHDKTLKDILD